MEESSSLSSTGSEEDERSQLTQSAIYVSEDFRDPEEYTLIILKPEVIEKKLIGSVLKYFDNFGFECVQMRMGLGTREQFRKHYNGVYVLHGRAIGDMVVQRMMRGPCIFAVYRGRDIINTSREFIGATDPSTARPLTIRRVYGDGIQKNVIHASDSKENARKEREIWFG